MTWGEYEMTNDTEIFEKLGKIAGTLEEVKNILTRTSEKNEKEHDDLRAEIAFRALKIDVDNMGSTMRKFEKRIDQLEGREDRKIATTVKNIGKYVAIFFGSSLFIFCVMNIQSFLRFLQEKALWK
jgi:hypothetical protein